jgi:transcriptional regulator with XRE-family HTH domain
VKTNARVAQRQYVPGTSRGQPNRASFLRQVADLAKGERLRALRNEHRLTQPEAAEIAGVTLRAYQEWEASGTVDRQGQLRESGIKWEHAQKLGSHYGVDAETLVRRPDAPLASGATSDDVAELRAQLAEVRTMLLVLLAHFELQEAHRQLDAAEQATPPRPAEKGKSRAAA